jgi:hypothetical protein
MRKGGMRGEVGERCFMFCFSYSGVLFLEVWACDRMTCWSMQDY